MIVQRLLFEERKRGEEEEGGGVQAVHMKDPQRF